MRRLAILWLTLLAAFWLTRTAVSALLFGHAETDRETVWSVLCIPAAQALLLGWVTRAPGASPLADLWRRRGSSRLGALLALVLAMLATFLGLAAPLAAAPPAQAAGAGPLNLGFEEGTAAAPLAGWLPSPAQAGSTFKAEVSAERPFEGDHAARLLRAGKGGSVSGLLQVLDASALRGQRVTLRAALRAEGEPGAGNAFLFLQARRAAGPAVSTQGPPPIRAWRMDEVSLEVPADAVTLEIGVLVTGEIRVDTDAFALFRLGRSSGPGDEPPRPLAPRGRDNLMALARLVGAVRFFHPSDGAARLDWDRFTTGAIGAVEPARDAGELAATLSRLIAPFAPTVAVFPTGQPPPPFQPVGAPGARPLAWRHSGLGTPVLASQAHYSSYRLGGGAPPEVSGSLFKALDARPLAGRRLRLEAMVESSGGLDGKPPAALLFLEADRDGIPLAAGQRALAAISSWQRASVELAVPEKAGQIVLGIRLDGPGRVRLDDVRLTLAAAAGEASADDAPGASAPAGAGRQVLLLDPFDGPAGEPPAGWIIEFSTEAAGYQAKVVREAPPGERQSAELAWTPGVELPDPAAPLGVDLGGGVSARVPLAVLADVTGTLPRSSAAPTAAGKPPGFLPSGHDRATRLAAVVLAWSALASFYPFFDAVGADWPAALPVALDAAATDPDAHAFDATLARLIAGLHDGHAFSDQTGNDEDDHRLPLIWRVVGGELTVLAVDPSLAGVQAGDAVIEIDGRPAAAALAEAEGRVSASTPGFRRLRAAGLLTTGRAGSARRLQLRRGDGPPFEVTVPFSLSIGERGRLRPPRPPELSEIRPGIWYVDLGRIADPDFERNVGKLAKAKGLIFDLRTYPTDITPDTLFGHLIDQRVRFGGDLNPIRTRPDRVERYELRQRWLTPKKPRLTAPVVFVTDERAISRAEIYLSLVTEAHLGTVVGVQTAGTRGERDELPLPAGYRVYWTAARAEKADGRPFQGLGIAPDVAAAPTRAGIAAGRDELLERALAVVAEGGSQKEQP